MSINLRSASDVEQKRINEPWGSLRWLASQSLGNAEGLTLGRVIIKPGMANPRHLHHASEEVLYLLAGRLEHWIGEEKVIVEAGDTLVVPPHLPHQAINIGDVDADMIVAYPTGKRDFVEG